jgi:uroporphyrinogen decarboxylase
MIENNRLLKAIFREKVDRTPVWIMRQAGRYLPEYRRLRTKVTDFLTLCKTPHLACEVTLQPIQRYPLDAAIVFSDILTIPDALGLGLHFIEQEGPCFQKPIRSANDIRQLPSIDPETELDYVMNAIRLTKAELANKIPLIGFAGSPWTLATYMVEGKSSKQFTEIKRLLYSEPSLLEQLLQHLTHVTADYLNAQINAGVDAVMLFDTWGGLLSPEHYLRYSLSYMQAIIQKINLSQTPRTVPIILFSKNAGSHLANMADSGCHVIGLDWCADLQHARKTVGHKVALQGNLDPTALYGNKEQIRSEVMKVLSAYGSGPGHIFNLGHGILPDISPEKVDYMIEAVHEFSPDLIEGVQR